MLNSVDTRREREKEKNLLGTVCLLYAFFCSTRSDEARGGGLSTIISFPKVAELTGRHVLPSSSNIPSDQGRLHIWRYVT